MKCKNFFTLKKRNDWQIVKNRYNITNIIYYLNTYTMWYNKLNGMRTDQTGKNYRNPSLSMFYQETYNEKFYEELCRMLWSAKKDIYNVLVCGAWPWILEWPLLRALSNIYKWASELNITFVDINKNPFKMLNYTLQWNRSKDDIMNNSDNLEDVELGKWYHIKDTNINYTFKEANLEFDPIENTNVEKVDLWKWKYDVIIMSMLLQHVSYWRSLIAYLNKFLDDDGVFMVNEFAGDDNLLCLNPEQAVKDLWYQVPTEIEKLFIDFIKHPFDIISDNDELAPTNMELLKHFFSTFNSTPTETSHYKIESTLSINDILGLIRNKVFSPFNKYADIFGTDLEDDINTASVWLDKNKQHILTYLLKWYIFKKIKDWHAEDLAEFDVFDENWRMSKEKLEKYINEVNSMLNKYKTIFSGEATTPAYEEIKERDMEALDRRLHPSKI